MNKGINPATENRLRTGPLGMEHEGTVRRLASDGSRQVLQQLVKHSTMPASFMQTAGVEGLAAALRDVPPLYARSIESALDEALTMLRAALADAGVEASARAHAG